MPTEQGYSNQKKLGKAQFKTIHSSGNDSFSSKAIPSTVYEKTAPAAIVAVTPVLGSSGQIEFYEIELTAHGAAVGDIMKMDTGTIVDFEFEIVKIIDVDNFYILPLATPVAGEDAEILGFTSQRTDRKGNLSVAVTVNTAGLSTEAKQDTQITKQDIQIANQDYAPVNTPIYVNLSSTNITTAAYVELLASTSTKARKIQVWLSNGNALYLAFGASSSEVDKYIVPPGAAGVLLDFVIPASTRLSAKAVAANATSGLLIINFVG